MPIDIACTSCNAQMKVKDELAGKKGKCPKCGGVINVPAATAVATAAVASALQAVAAPAAVGVAQDVPGGNGAAESIRVECRDCEHRFKVDPSKAGKKVRCPECDYRCRVPELDDDEKAESAPRKRRRGRDEDNDDDEPRDRKKRDRDCDDDEPRDRKNLDKDDEDNQPKDRKDRNGDDEPKERKKRDKDNGDDEERDERDEEDGDDRPAKKKKKKRRGEGLWRESPLWDNDRFMLIVPFSGFFVPGRFWTLKEADSKEDLGNANQTGSWFTRLVLGKFGSFAPIKIEVAEPDDGPILFSVRKLSRFRNFVGGTVEVYDDEDEMFCYFKTKLISLGGGFWLYNDKDKKIGEVKVGMKPWPYLGLYTLDGQELGRVTTNKNDFKKGQKFKFMLRSEAYIVTPAEDLEDPADGKRLLLAMALAMELTGTGDIILGRDKTPGQLR